MKFKDLKTITTHPLTKERKSAALWRYLKRGIVFRICPYPIAYPFIEPSQLLIERGMSSAELQIFTGLYDYHEMFFLLHYLSPDDLFVDVGANVGVYTVLASAVKGSGSISLEPVPGTYQHLLNNIALNHIGDKVKALNIGVGEKSGELRFTKNLNSAVNHVQADTEDKQDSVVVKVDSLDHILAGENPSLVKIDVEGFETMVIKGASDVLKRESLRAIIIELNGLSNRYGFNDKAIHDTIISNGFEPYIYYPHNRSFERLDTFGDRNTIYMRDMEFIKKRIANAPKFKVLNHIL